LRTECWWQPDVIVMHALSSIFENAHCRDAILDAR
jgi:hypothetical protein